MPETPIFFRWFRPEPDEPFSVWVKRQIQTVYVNRRDLPELQAAGATNVAVLEVGGPQPREAWVAR